MGFIETVKKDKNRPRSRALYGINRDKKETGRDFIGCLAGNSMWWWLKNRGGV